MSAGKRIIFISLHLRMPLFLPYSWKIFSLAIGFWVDNFFFFLHFKDVILFLSFFHSFWWKICDNFHHFSLKMIIFIIFSNILFSLATSKIFSLVLVFSNNLIMCLDVVLTKLLEIHWVFLICKFQFFKSYLGSFLLLFL